MGIDRSTFYENPAQSGNDTAIVGSMAAICEEFEHTAGVASELLCVSKA